MGLAVQFSTIVEMYQRITEKYPTQQRAVILHKAGGKYAAISYSDLKERVRKFGTGLAALGVSRGDNIGLISENRPEWVIADLGMLHLGAVNVPLYPSMTPKQIEFIFNDAGVKYAIVSNQFQLNKVLSILDQVKSLRKVIVIAGRELGDNDCVISFADVLASGEQFEIKHPQYFELETKKVDPDDLLSIIYTSGTVGNPKGVMLTHKNLVSNIQAAAECIPITRDDTFLSVLPLCHSFERMAGYYTAMSCGATIAFAESFDTLRENLREVRPHGRREPAESHACIGSLVHPRQRPGCGKPAAGPPESGSLRTASRGHCRLAPQHGRTHHLS